MSFRNTTLSIIVTLTYLWVTTPVVEHHDHQTSACHIEEGHCSLMEDTCHANIYHGTLQEDCKHEGHITNKELSSVDTPVLSNQKGTALKPFSTFIHPLIIKKEIITAAELALQLSHQKPPSRAPPMIVFSSLF